MFEVDEELRDTTFSSGIDEVGRGCLAGPVVVAAVTWDHRKAARQPWFPLLADSKQLSAETRAQLFPLILAEAQRVRLASLSHMLVDYLNILVASHHGFELVAPPYDPEAPLFIDGANKPKSLAYGRTLVRGDARQSAIAAASVVAKVTRDALMVELAQLYPHYGFERHMGYGTAFHKQALARHGASRLHRKSYRPVTVLCDSSAARDEAWLQRLDAVADADVTALWRDFSDQYAALSLEGARRVMAAFQRRGLALLPSPRDLA